MKATMKQIVAASSVGIIRVPNQPTYRRLSVEVTHSQKESQAELVERWEIEEEAISHSKYVCEYNSATEIHLPGTSPTQ